MKLLAIALALGLALPASADEPPPKLLWGHAGDWYAGWSLVVAGGAAELAGIALTTGLVNSDAGATPSDTQSTTGWVLVGVGTATWIAGTLVFALSDRRAARRATRAR